MKITSLRTPLIVASLLTIVSSCQQDSELTPTHDSFLTKAQTEAMTKLGKQLENPYSVENMRKAYDNIKSSQTSGRTNEEIEISTTHLYYKFKPKNDEELALLKTDSMISFFEYPLDFEILQAGTFYHDPEVPIGTPTYQYASIPVDHAIPAIDYELLADLFIPDDFDDTSVSSGRIATAEFIMILVDEALRITNNLDSETKSEGRSKGGSWRPAGRVRVWDNSVSPATWRAVEGVEVSARRWFTTHKGTTNAQGNYSCDGTFNRDANYSLDWERYNFALREGWLDGANINGPKQEGNWNVDLNGGVSMFHARVFMAAHHYYYKDIKSLRRPPANGTFKTQMHIRCYDESNDESNGTHKPGRRFLGLGSAIKIYNPSRAFADIYATTIHELAHASHWNMSSSDYNNAEDKVSESWARGVQWELTRMVWTNYFGGATIKPSYTQVVVDMIDDAAPLTGGNPTNINIGSEDLTQDNVTGYSVRNIEDALNGQRTWNGWRDNIKNRYTNATEPNLDALFAYWN